MDPVTGLAITNIVLGLGGAAAEKKASDAAAKAAQEAANFNADIINVISIFLTVKQSLSKLHNLSEKNKVGLNSMKCKALLLLDMLQTVLILPLAHQCEDCAKMHVCLNTKWQSKDLTTA